MQNYPTLPKSFYLKSTEVVAKELLGKALFFKKGRSSLLFEITETEAYLSQNDPACHAAKGLTKRNRPMFELGGRSYVYLCYGVHYCLNVVTGKKGCGEAVLIRGMRDFFNQIDPKSLNGPGKLTKTLGIDLSFNGREFREEGFKLVDLNREIKPSEILTTPRIGISKAVDLPLRFLLKG